MATRLTRAEPGSTATPSARTQRLDWVEVGRGLAALAVVIFHANASARYFGGPHWRWPVFFSHGVDFFFVLSGFVILHAHARDIGHPDRLGGYLLKRAIRLFPTLWVVVAGWALLRWAVGAHVDVTHLLGSLLPWPALGPTIPPVVWTLRHELVFYALFAVMIASRHVGVSLFALWLAAIAAQLAAAPAGRAIGGLPAFFISGYSADFMLGMAVYLVHRRWPARPSPVPLAAAVLLLVGAALALGPAGFSRAGLGDYVSWNATGGALLLGLLFAGILYGLLRMEGWVRAPAPLVALGATSYALYLVHTPVNSVVQHAARELPPAVRQAGGGHLLLIVAGVIAGWLLYRYFERTVVAWLRIALDPGRRSGRLHSRDPGRTGFAIDAAGSPAVEARAQSPLRKTAKETRLAFWNKRRIATRPGADAAGSRAGGQRGAAADLERPGLPSFQESVSGAARSIRADPLRGRMRTAFTPSQPVSDVRMFAGRHELLRTIIRAIEDQQLHVVLYGDRGIGKTSTLHVLSQLADRAGYQVRYTSSGESSSFDEVLRSVLADVPLLYHADFDPALGSAEGSDTLASILPAHPLSVADVTRVMGKLTATRLLIILDEFDRCESEQFRRSIAELIKNVSDRSLPVQLVIGGVAANLSELIEYLPSIRRNILGLPMPSMTVDELKEIVAIGASVSGLRYAPDAAAAIAQSAAGSPYLGSLLGQHAGITALDRGADMVTQQDVRVAIALALREMELRVSPESLRAIRNVGDPRLQATLAVLARTALTNIGRIDASDPAHQHDNIAAADVERLERDYAIIERVPHGNGESYRFRDQSAPLLIWLQRLQVDSSRLRQ